jgi:pilus assembly protein Flp/PilA
MHASRRRSQRGQGLVEYALILLLVGIVVIIALTTAGERIRDIFCDVVLSLDAGAAANTAACAAPRVSFVINPGAMPHTINIQAIIKDNKGPKEPNIVSVAFYIDGTLVNTEHYSIYCLHGGSATACNDYSLPAGSHTVRAVATDVDGNTGESSANFTV